MLEHLGHGEAAQAVERAIESVLGDPHSLTPDMGGAAATKTLGEAIAEAVIDRSPESTDAP